MTTFTHQRQRLSPSQTEEPPAAAEPQAPQVKADANYYSRPPHVPASRRTAQL